MLRATLPNGLRVVIVRNALAPVVATSVNYLAGSDEAPPGFPGTAHAEEHMMFRGSPGLTAEQLADIGSILGGDFNANTREGMTQYLFTVPAEDLDLALHIEALRMRAILASGKEWQNERGAIEQEVAQDLSEPGYLLFEKLRARMFAGTPYAHDALGTRPSFDKTTAQMLKTFHDSWYAPNNAILVIAGNVDPQGALSEVKRLFGDIPAKKLPPKPAVHLRPVQPASFQVDTDQPSGTMMIAMRTPGPRDPDFAALEVLADVLNSRRFALYGLVPQGKATGAEFALEPLPQAAVAYAALTFTSGDDPKALAAEVRAILARVVREGVPEELVTAAKLQERAADQFQRNSIPELASVWSDAIALYGLDSPDEDLARIERVTAADVNRVARKYLDLDHAITGIMVPRGSGAPVASRGFGGQENISLGEAHPTALPAWAQKALTRLEVPPSTLSPIVSRLANGLTLIVQPEDVSDTVSVYGHIRNRAEIQEPRGQEGVAALLDRLLTYGSERLDRVAFQQQLDAIGAKEKAGTDFSTQVLSEHFDRAVELLADNELQAGASERSPPGDPRAAGPECRRTQYQPRLPHAALTAQCALPGARSQPAHVHARDRTCPQRGCGARLLSQRISPRPGHRGGHRQGVPGSGASCHREILRLVARRRCAPRDRSAGCCEQRREQHRRSRQQPGAGSGRARPDTGVEARRRRLLPAGARKRRAGRQLLRHAPQHRPAQERGAGVFGGFAAAGGAHTQRLLHRVCERSPERAEGGRDGGTRDRGDAGNRGRRR